MPNSATKAIKNLSWPFLVITQTKAIKLITPPVDCCNRSQNNLGRCINLELKVAQSPKLWFSPWMKPNKDLVCKNPCRSSNTAWGSRGMQKYISVLIPNCQVNFNLSQKISHAT